MYRTIGKDRLLYNKHNVELAIAEDIYNTFRIEYVEMSKNFHIDKKNSFRIKHTNAIYQSIS